mmetsp:Transcript_21173/g.50252  ORF Transcript_21173/g.50252 Transcript_21173/m.50252 type:complete len:519 (+) Transcript_21173:235-1791(+)
MILSKIPWLITIRILSIIDEEGSGGGIELAGAALATTLCNVTGMSLCVGFSFALSTLAGQAKGEMVSRAAAGGHASPREADDDDDAAPNTPVVFLLRGLLVQLILCVPVGIWWLLGIEDFLVRLGQAPALADRAATYLKILAPSLWAYSISWTTTSWANSIGMADVPARAALLGLALHVPFNVLFCYVLGMGYLGCAWATVAFQTVQCLYTLSYSFRTSEGRRRVLASTGGTAVGRASLTLLPELRIAAGSLRGFLEYLGLAIPGLIIISEWWASETAIFMSGRLHPDPQTALAAMTVYQSINSFCFMIPSGMSVAGTTRVGNLLGAGRASAAKLAGTVSVGLCLISSGLVGTLLFLLPHGLFPGLFVSSSENPSIVDTTAATIPLLALYTFADGIQTGLNGVMKGCGRQRTAVPIVVFAYWVVGVPLAWYLGLGRTGGDNEACAVQGSRLCGDLGLVAGMTTGTWIHMILLAIAAIGTIDWKSEAERARRRVAVSVERRRRRRRAGKDDYDDLERAH